MYDIIKFNIKEQVTEMSFQESNLPGMLERGKLSAGLALGMSVLSAALALTIFIAGPVYQWSGMRLFDMGLLPFILSFIFAVSALVRSKFLIRTVAEEEEKRLLEKRKENVSSLLDISEDVRFTAKRTLLNFEKYVPGVIAVCCFILVGISLYIFRTNSLLQGSETELLGSLVPKNPINLAFMSILCAAFAFFGGIFTVGQSHVREFRYLRPVGAWLIAGAGVMLLSALGALLIYYGKEGWDTVFEKTVFGIYCVLGAELLWNFIVEFYRPRTRREFRPVYESRLLSLFTEPGGVVRNMAKALDYQFGFELSKTSLYLFIRKYFVPALLVWGAVLWLFTSIAEVPVGELGIRERFGAAPKDKSVLTPGVHLKMPWPFERIVKVPVNVVNEVVIGSKVDEKKTAADAAVVLWDGLLYQHGDAFLVAAKTIGNEKAAADEFPLSLLEASLPVYYRAKPEQAYEYAFGFENISASLLAIGEAEATRYFASSNFISDISNGRAEVSSTLKRRIQKACDDVSMGVEIVAVGMQDAHPPVGQRAPDGAPNPESPNVAAAFQDVVSASENAIAARDAAHAAAETNVTGAKIEAIGMIADAKAYRNEVVSVAEAEVVQFRSRLAADNAMSDMFRLNTYLAMLRDSTADARKYIISSGIKLRIFEFNFEEQAKLDLTNADLSTLGK